MPHAASYQSGLAKHSASPSQARSTDRSNPLPGRMQWAALRPELSSAERQHTCLQRPRML
jgi:hypothetical protein